MTDIFNGGGKVAGAQYNHTSWFSNLRFNVLIVCGAVDTRVQLPHPHPLQHGKYINVFINI